MINKVREIALQAIRSKDDDKRLAVMIMLKEEIDSGTDIIKERYRLFKQAEKIWLS